MTGDVLRRIRESYGLSTYDCGRLSGMSASGVSVVERKSTSYKCGVRKADNDRRRKTWRQIIRMLRACKAAQGTVPPSKARRARVQEAERETLPPAKPVPCPQGATHLLGEEFVRVAVYHGQTRAFAWDGEWVRSARVEDALKCGKLKEIQ